VRALAFAALAAAAIVVAGATARTDQRPVLSVVVKSSGKVTTFDGRLGCRSRCSARYGRGRLLRLTGTPDQDFRFNRWDGACIGKAALCDVALDGNTHVRAWFIGVPTQLALSVGGPGRITNAKAGIECGSDRSACVTTVPYASTLTLTPVPDAGGRFGGWDGQCASAGSGPCVARVELPRTEILGAFGHSSPQAGPQQLSVFPDSNHVTSAPGGIDCSPTCSALFPSGTFVVLTRLDTGVWHAPCVGKLRRCALFVDVPTEASVGPPPPPDPPPPRRPRGELQVTVSGGGLVLGAAGIVCGWSPRTRNECSYDFETYFTLTRHLQAVATRRVRFVRWGGLCHGKSRTCTVQMTNNRRKDLSTFAVTALFRRR
jgi:hypothetical protein